MRWQDEGRRWPLLAGSPAWVSVLVSQVNALTKFMPGSNPSSSCLSSMAPTASNAHCPSLWWTNSNSPLQFIPNASTWKTLPECSRLSQVPFSGSEQSPYPTKSDWNQLFTWMFCTEKYVLQGHSSISIHLTIHLPWTPTDPLIWCSSIHPSTCPSIHPPTHPSIHPSIHPPVHPSIHVPNIYLVSTILWVLRIANWKSLFSENLFICVSLAPGRTMKVRTIDTTLKNSGCLLSLLWQLLHVTWKSNHYAVYLKLNTSVNYISIKLAEK